MNKVHEKIADFVKEINTSLFELFEFFKAFCFRYGGHILGLRPAFFIVADYDASLPSAVLALA
jgi:hypothetical protein